MKSNPVLSLEDNKVILHQSVEKKISLERFVAKTLYFLTFGLRFEPGACDIAFDRGKISNTVSRYHFFGN